MNKKLKNFKFLNTDFYQISMGFAYVVLGKNKEKTGFEGFVRNIKKEINPNQNYYIFDGEKEVLEYIKEIKKELNNPALIDTFVSLIEPKITNKNKNKLINTFKKNWETINKDFEFTIIPNGTMIKPFVPVFQYYGDKFIGQIIETYITNIYNGRTAIKTLEHLKNNKIDIKINDYEYKYLKDLMNGKEIAINNLKIQLNRKAKEFRNSTKVKLLEAAFRRAPTKKIADMASLIAIGNGWNGTSNVTLRLNNEISDEYIGGTMAHSFVMSFDNEEEAFEAWNSIFPKTTMLIDTYNVKNAINIIINLSNKIKKGNNLIQDIYNKMFKKKIIELPKEVRLDSEPIQQNINICRRKNKNIDIFISGDISPKKLKEIKGYSKAMAGTKYIYGDSLISKLNSGFVYKIVQYEKKNKLEEVEIKYPKKEIEGKTNYSGLKHMVFDIEKNELNVYCKTNAFGYNMIQKVNENTKINFI